MKKDKSKKSKLTAKSLVQNAEAEKALLKMRDFVQRKEGFVAALRKSLN